VSRTLPNVVRNSWLPDARGPVVVARILDHRTSPEGLDVERIRFVEAGSIQLDPAVGQFLSVLSGGVDLHDDRDGNETLQLADTTHAYVPPGWPVRLEAPDGAEILLVSGAHADQARGTRLLVRDEQFLAACATDSQELRWILTSQYLSRRIFVQHDSTLLSRSGDPVSWYRTTMFDVAGLPPNEDGEPVFKMAYSSRTEFNVCYNVQGHARVRMAEHPYRSAGQAWGPWLSVDEESTYHVNEARRGGEEERWVDESTGEDRTSRNKHEVHISDGYVTLFCLFDPAPTGFESHRPGEYSDYTLSTTAVDTQRFQEYLRGLAPFDAMVDELSMAKARGALGSVVGSPAWRLYERGRRAQVAHETALLESLAHEGAGRSTVVAPWITDPAG
jgi:hypothetical protein